MRAAVILSLSVMFFFVEARPSVAWQDEKPPDYRNKSFAEWVRALQKEGEDGREATEVLGPKGPYAKVAVSALLESLKDDKRKGAGAHLFPPRHTIYTVAEYGPGVLPTLLMALSRSDPSVRAGAINTIELIDADPSEVIPALTAALKDPAPNVRVAAGEALGRIGPGASAAVGALISSLQDTDELVRKTAADTLYEIGPASKPGIPVLITVLQDKFQAVRQSAARALGKQGADAKEAVPALLRALSQIKRDDDGREFVRGLGQIGPPSKAAVPTLIALLQTNLFRDAAEALGNIGPDARAAVPALAKLVTERVKDSAYPVDAIIRALGKIGPDAAAAVPALIEVLKISDVIYKGPAAIALGQIGSRAKSATPALDVVAHDTDVNFMSIEAVKAALHAAAQIDPADALKRGLDPALILIRLGDIPAIKAKPRPKVTEVEKSAIKALIGKLAEIEDPDIGMSATLSGAAFAPLPGREDVGAFILRDHGLKHSSAFQSLVRMGPEAIPFLLNALGDKSPTRLRVHAGIGGMSFAAELPGNPLNPLEKQPTTPGDELDPFPEDRHQLRDAYTVKVGDVCFVALGQIVARRYQAVRYQPSMFVVLNSPVHDQYLRERVRSIWLSQDPAQKLLDSLLRDYATEWTLNGKPLLQGSTASRLQVESTLRLLYYFQAETAALIAARLRSLDVRDSDTTKEFIKAVSWCKEPAIRKALADIGKRTDDPEILQELPQ
jgi:HEAT repeat protein